MLVSHTRRGTSDLAGGEGIPQHGREPRISADPMLEMNVLQESAVAHQKVGSSFMSEQNASHLAHVVTPWAYRPYKRALPPDRGARIMCRYVLCVRFRAIAPT